MEKTTPAPKDHSVNSHAEARSLADCIRQCRDCRSEVQRMFFAHCLEQGGPHSAREHVLRLQDCMDLCLTAADVMERESTLYPVVCLACAEACESAATSCLAIDDGPMNALAAICRQTAEMCRNHSLDSAQSAGANGKATRSPVTEEEAPPILDDAAEAFH